MRQYMPSSTGCRNRPVNIHKLESSDREGKQNRCSLYLKQTHTHTQFMTYTQTHTHYNKVLKDFQGNYCFCTQGACYLPLLPNNKQVNSLIKKQIFLNWNKS